MPSKEKIMAVQKEDVLRAVGKLMGDLMTRGRTKETKLILSRFFDKPKCKPWDIVKGRRFKCCHGLGEHTRWCSTSLKVITVPKFGRISAEDLTSGT